MLSAMSRTQDTHFGHPAGLATPLAPAPEGLSARRVERWLDLPVGAWQRRRLYGLRLRNDAFAALGFRNGDLVVVEPGSRERPGKTVVTRSHDGMSLRRIPLPLPRDNRMPSVLELPLRDPSTATGERIVGTVIGLLRPTGTGALRPVPLSRASVRVAAARRSPRTWEVAADSHPQPAGPGLDTLRTVLSDWREWIAARRGSAATTATDARLDHWERLETSLATLCDCLAHTHNTRLRSALAEEAAQLLDEIRRETGR